MVVDDFLRKVIENKEGQYNHFVVAYEKGRGQRLMLEEGLSRGTDARLSSSEKIMSVLKNDSLYEAAIGLDGALFPVIAYLKRDYVLRYNQENTEFAGYYVISWGPLMRTKEMRKGTMTPIIREERFLGVFKRKVVVGYKPKEVEEQGYIVVHVAGSIDHKAVNRLGGWLAYSIVLPDEEGKKFLSIMRESPQVLIDMLRIKVPNIIGVRNVEEAFFIKNPQEYKENTRAWGENVKKIVAVLRTYKLKDDTMIPAERDHDVGLLRMDETDAFEQWRGWVVSMIKGGKREKIKEIVDILNRWE